MHVTSGRRVWPCLSASFIILTLFLIALWVAGGASRADVLGQVITRGAAAASLVALILFAPRSRLTAGAPLLLLAGAAAIVAVQLVPLPFSVWSALPGRTPLAEFVAPDQSWRPLTMNPSMTMNALLSLLTPVLVMLAMSALSSRERALLLPFIIGLVAAAALFGVFQFSVGYFDNPLINDTPWQVTGPFANRNHFALFLAIGCLLVPAWFFGSGDRIGWSGLLAVGLLIFFILMILASGSRAGLLVGVIATVIGFVMARRTIKNRLRHAPKWASPTLLIALVCIIMLAVSISFGAGRAESLNRLFSGGGQDGRARVLPIIADMVRNYFPVGVGVGGFDTAFRLNEPFDHLKLTYWNHAHNDMLEIVLDAGLLGLVWLVSAIGWWAWASARAWRADNLLPKLGSAMILLVGLASFVDYPIRTPMIMAMTIVAGMWLSDRLGPHGRSALPKLGQPL